jgi:hypothetical protein
VTDCAEPDCAASTDVDCIVPDCVVPTFAVLELAAQGGFDCTSLDCTGLSNKSSRASDFVQVFVDVSVGDVWQASLGCTKPAAARFARSEESDVTTDGGSAFGNFRTLVRASGCGRRGAISFSICRLLFPQAPASHSR